MPCWDASVWVPALLLICFQLMQTLEAASDGSRTLVPSYRMEDPDGSLGSRLHCGLVLAAVGVLRVDSWVEELCLSQLLCISNKMKINKPTIPLLCQNLVKWRKLTKWRNHTKRCLPLMFYRFKYIWQTSEIPDPIYSLCYRAFADSYYNIKQAQ